MDLSCVSPIIINFVPKPNSSIIFEFKARGEKNGIKIKVEMNVYYKMMYHHNMTLLKSSGPHEIYLSTESRSYNIRMFTPAFDKYIKAYISIKTDCEDNIIVEDTWIRDIPPDERIMFISSWGVKCGIASYTEDLMRYINGIKPNISFINPIDQGILMNDSKSRLTHLQHEFSIIPSPPIIDGKVIITWHTIPEDVHQTVKLFESNLDVVAHIVTCEEGSKFLDTRKDLFVISLGSTLMPDIKKEEARRILSINIDKPIGFVFGFQSPNKNYQRLINAARNTNIHIIISGCIHQSGYEYKITDSNNVTILNRYLTDQEINLYSLASDLLLYDYIEQEHYSSSSAMHRTIGAGRPVVCTNTNHFNDINTDTALKFNNQQELEDSIRRALEDKERLGRLALEFAKKTSWEEVARKHIEVYRRYIDI